MYGDDFLNALDERVLVFDGAMGTQLMARELTTPAFGGDHSTGATRRSSSNRPDVVTEIHDAYLEAGADVIETNSFTASRLKLDEYGLGERIAEINRFAAATRARLRPTASRPASGRASSPARSGRPGC